MKTFHCTCRQPLFFQNRKCLACGSAVAYDPTSRVLTAVKPESGGRWSLRKDGRRPRPVFRFCAQRESAAACNWLVPADRPYGAALRHHYAAGPPADWRNRYISAYAAAHPWEDWAESWAHYLHLRATLETVTSFKLNTAKVDLRIDPFTRDVLYRQEPVEAGDAFLGWVNAWVVLTAVLNEVARSMGQPDVYPFVMNGPVVTKLHFVHCAIRGREDAPVAPPPASLAQPEA